MKSVLYLLISFVLIFLLNCSSNYSTNQKEEIKVTSSNNKIDSLNSGIVIQLSLINAGKQVAVWTKFWKKIDSKFGIEFFEKKWKKELPIKWIDYKESEYQKSFKFTYKYSDDKTKAIDMYSFSTVFEKNNNNLYASFNVDSRVFVIDFSKNKRTEILFSGAYEVLQDCFWINNNELAVLGFVDDNGGYIPFIWVFNIKQQQQIYYSYIETLDKCVNDYFFKKFPEIKNEEDY